MAEILPTYSPKLFQEAVGRAVELLRRGEVVALPTETVYGLAANALDANAVAQIYEVKGRPQQNPIILHVCSIDMAQRCVRDWPAPAQQLAASFWPGPLTLVLHKSGVIPQIVTAGGATVGVRWPSHPFIQAVIRACDFPLAAPSANRSNQLSPTTAEHVHKSLGNRIPLIVDGGPSHVGIESTVLDLTAEPARVLRPGMIHEESLLAVIGAIDLKDRSLFQQQGKDDEPLRSPGLLRRHYSPKARVRLLSWKNDSELREKISRTIRDPGKVHIIAHTQIPLTIDGPRVSVIPHDPEAFARAIYSELHRCDEEGANAIIIEQVPDSPAWHGIADRLRRAASE